MAVNYEYETLPAASRARRERVDVSGGEMVPRAPLPLPLPLRNPGAETDIFGGYNNR